MSPNPLCSVYKQLIKVYLSNSFHILQVSNLCQWLLMMDISYVVVDFYFLECVKNIFPIMVWISIGRGDLLLDLFIKLFSGLNQEIDIDIEGKCKLCRRCFVIPLNSVLMFVLFWNSFWFKLIIYIYICPGNIVYNNMAFIVKNTLASTKNSMTWKIKQTILSAQLIWSHFFGIKNNWW